MIYFSKPFRHPLQRLNALDFKALRQQADNTANNMHDDDYTTDDLNIYLSLR